MTVPSKKRVLVVDDLPHWRKLIATLLIDYDVEAIASYEEALNTIASSKFDVTVLDLRLEDNNIWNIDGIYLLKEIRRQQPTASVLILTGYRESVRDQILRDFKPDEIVDKEDFDNTEFRNTIQRLANRTSDQ